MFSGHLYQNIFFFKVLEEILKTVNNYKDNFKKISLILTLDECIYIYIYSSRVDIKQTKMIQQIFKSS